MWRMRRNHPASRGMLSLNPVFTLERCPMPMLLKIAAILVPLAVTTGLLHLAIFALRRWGGL